MPHPSHGRIAQLAAVLLVVLCAAVPARAQYTMSDPLRDGATYGHAVGGSFGPDGWTVTDRTDRMWFER